MIRVLMALAAALTASAASAADLGGPLPAPTAVTVEAVKTLGCYVDAGVGFGVTVSEFKTEDAKLPLSPSGALASVGGGCDIRVSGLILGGFATYAIGEMAATSVDGANRMVYTTQNAWAIGGRIGYQIQEPTLIYARLGYAGAASKLSEDAGEVFDRRLTGLLVGAGLETRIKGPLHFRFGLDAYLWGTEGLDNGAVKAESRTITTTAGVVFKF